MQVAHPEGWPGVDASRVSVRLLHRNLISMLLFDVLGESARRGAGYADLLAVRASETPVVDFSRDMREQVDAMRKFLLQQGLREPAGGASERQGRLRA